MLLTGLLGERGAVHEYPQIALYFSTEHPIVRLGGLIDIPFGFRPIHPDMGVNTIPKVGIVNLLFSKQVPEPQKQRIHRAVVPV